MGRGMMDSGRTIKLMAGEGLYMIMGTTIVDIGKMARIMVLESFKATMATGMKANGSTITCMAMAEKPGLIILLTKENI